MWKCPQQDILYVEMILDCYRSISYSKKVKLMEKSNWVPSENGKFQGGLSKFDSIWELRIRISIRFHLIPANQNLRIAYLIPFDWFPFDPRTLESI